MVVKFMVRTKRKEEFINITSHIQREIHQQNFKRGFAHIFVPHTTAAVTINENADPDVIHDIMKGLTTMVPQRGFSHREGNSPAHIKSSLIGASLCINVEHGDLVLGTWQGVFLCEFDGPRERKVLLSLCT